MNIETFANAVVAQELVGKGREDEALCFQFRLNLSHYHDGMQFRSGRGLILLYHLMPGYSYVTVFSGVSPSSFTDIKEVEFFHEVTHDSCWRNIGAFSKVYFEMAKDVNTQLLAAGLSEIAPRDMSESNFFLLFGKAFTWQKVKVSKDPSDTNNYRKIVQVL